ncbi:MAG: D-alanyl-D-alanine carboxypeptidase [Oceanicaulis sp.]|nr:D-alanyl-D-alanine carboxypeptidase [Oceanicaulis sp.]
MANTVFRNASGLPDARQQTTARDIARLAYALHRDFPQYYAYFSETRFRWNGVTHRTHNTLVGDQPGVDGLKTGYIRASGFNLAASAERDGHRIIAVVMGGPPPLCATPCARADRSRVFRHQRPLRKPDAGGVEHAAAQSRAGARDSDRRTHHATRPDGAGLGPGVPAARVELEPLDGLRTFSAPETPSGWAVQVGAYTSQAAASARLESVCDDGTAYLAGDAQARVEPMQRNGASSGGALCRP